MIRGNLRRAFILYGRYKVAWAVREDSPLKTWRDAVEWAKTHPGQLTFGHPGVAPTPNLVMTKIAAASYEQLIKEAGLYKSEKK